MVSASPPHHRSTPRLAADPFPDTVQWRWTLCCLIIALATGVRFWRLDQQLFLHPDDALHILMVQRFAEEHILEWTQARPMYPYILGHIMRLLHPSVLFLAQVAAICGVLTVGVVLLWARAQWGLGVAVSAALMLAVSQQQIYHSKISSPVTQGMLLVALGCALITPLFGAVGNLATRTLPSVLTRTFLCGLVLGLAVTMHRAFLPFPVFVALFLMLSAFRFTAARAGAATLALLGGVFLPMLAGQIVTELHQPPNINNFGYINQLQASFAQQGVWREGPGGRGWGAFVSGYLQSDGIVPLALGLQGIALGIWRWQRNNDWACGFLVTVTGATFVYASAVSAAGGISVPRAVAPGIPSLVILSGLAFMTWVALLRRTLPQRLPSSSAGGVLLLMLALAGVVQSLPVINARTGYQQAVALMRENAGFAAVYDGDPWRVLTAPASVVIVGPKRLDLSPQVRAQDRASALGPCHLMLHHFQIAGDQLIVPGAAVLSLSQLGAPALLLENNRDQLIPAGLEDTEQNFADEIRVYVDPSVCQEIHQD